MRGLFSDFISIRPNSKADDMKKWKRCFNDTCKAHDLFNGDERIMLKVENGLLRFFYAPSINRYDVVNIENIALTIAFLLNKFDPCMAENILEFAECFFRKWDLFIDRRNKDLTRSEDESSIDFNLIDVLSDRDKVYKAYFNSFSTPEGDTLIRVYLPRPNESWIRWDKDNSVLINIFSPKYFERGFFIIGFDYAVVHDSEEGNLRVACLSASEEYETALFSTVEIGKLTSNTIWAL